MTNSSKKQTLKKIFYSMAVFWLVPFLALAEVRSSGPSISGKLTNPLGGIDTLWDFIAVILKIVAQIGFPIAVLAIVYTGFLFVKAQGNEAELATAKKAFFWTVIGTLVLLGAEAIGFAISGTIGAFGN